MPHLSIDMQYGLYALPSLVAAFIAGFLAAYVWRLRHAQGGGYFVLFILAELIWSLGYSLEVLTPALSGKLVWTGIEYVGIMSVPVFWLFFVLRMTGYERLINWRSLAVLSFIPLLTVVAVWTNPLHGWHYVSVGLKTSDVAFPVMDLAYGPTFWIAFVYNYLVLLAAAGLLLRQAITVKGLRRRQALMMLVAAAVPWVANLITLVARLGGWPGIGGINFTPVGFALSGLLVAWSVFGLRVLELMPAAYDTVFQNMGDAVFVLDQHGVVVDVNAAAARSVGQPPDDLVGLTVHHVLPDLRRVGNSLEDLVGEQIEIGIIPPDDHPHTYLMHVSRLQNWRGRYIGMVMSLREITMRLQAEQQLRESEARYRALFEAPFESIVVHVNGQILDINSTLESLLGYTREEVVGQPVTVFVAEDERDKVMQRVQSGYQKAYETVLMTKDGSRLPVEVRAKYIDYRDQQVRVAGIRDLTLRKQLEAAQREQHALSEALRNSAAALNSTLDLDDVLERILQNVGLVVPHKAATIMLIDQEQREAYIVRASGYKDKIDGKDITDIRVPLDGSKNLARMLETGQPYILPDVSQQPEWHLFEETSWISSYAGAPITLDDEVIGFLNLDSDQPGFFRPHHGERLKAFANQAATAIKNARLYGESQRRNRQLGLLNRITRVGAAAVDLDEILQTLADSAAEIIGGDGCYISLWDEHTQRPQPAAAYGPFRESYREFTVPSEAQTLTESVLEAGHPLIIRDVQHDTPYVSSKITEAFPARSLLALPLITDERKIGALLLAFNDLHIFTDDEVAWSLQAADLIALAIDKAQAYAELQIRNEELDAFSHTVAHDLKSPLSSLAGFLMLVLDEADDLSDDNLELLERAKQNAFKMNQIIDSLLLLAQLRQTEQALEPVDVRPVVQAAVERFRGDINRRGIDVQISPDLPPAMAFGPWVEEAFANLIGNAVKYIGLENSDPWIIIEGERLDDHVRYTVKDNGLGMSPENQAQMFEMFSRFHKAEAMGMGLGLSIVRRLVRKLNGEAGVDSQVGEGSTFWFTLPSADLP